MEYDNDDQAEQSGNELDQDELVKDKQHKRRCKRFKRVNNDAIKQKDKLLLPRPSDDVDHVSKLLEIYVTSIKENEIYNAKYMTHYYSLLLRLADRHETFKRGLLDHNNWRWSLRAFVLGTTGLDEGPLHDIILGGTMRYIQEDEPFRCIMLPCLAGEAVEGGKKSLITQSRTETGTLKLLLKFLQPETHPTRDRTDAEDADDAEDAGDNLLDAFLGEKYRGLSQLSTSAEKFHLKLENDQADANVKCDLVLEGLSLSLECICFVLNDYGMNQVHSLMTTWPEVDDINFVCTQIVTRTSEDWKPFFDHQDVACKIESMRVVEHASELLKILASAETVAEVEAE